MNNRPTMLMFLTLYVVTLGAISYAIAEVNEYTWKDIATFFGPTTQEVELCWRLEGPDILTRVEWQRGRYENQKPEPAVKVMRADWKPWMKDGVQQGWCGKVPKLKTSGHYVYQMRICTTNKVTNADVCSPWGTSLDFGEVDGARRAWWQYGYTPPPSSVTPLPSGFDLKYIPPSKTQPKELLVHEQESHTRLGD